jgi:hypothetical protein
MKESRRNMQRKPSCRRHHDVDREKLSLFFLSRSKGIPRSNDKADDAALRSTTLQCYRTVAALSFITIHTACFPQSSVCFSLPDSPRSRRRLQMTPTEFAVRLITADQRFSQALKRDDIPEMRAALADKNGLLKLYFAESRQATQQETDGSVASH